MSKNEMKLLMIDGRTFAIKINLIPQLMLHRYSLGVLVLSFAAIFTLKPYEFLERSPTWFAAPFLFFSMITMHLLVVFVILLVWVGIGRRRMMTLPATAISTVTLMYAADHLLFYLMDDPVMDWFAFLLKGIFSAVFAEIVMFFYFTVIYTAVAGEQIGEPEAVPEDPIVEGPIVYERRYIDAGGVPVAVCDVLYLEAQQSYVNIVTAARSYLVRRKFFECMADLPEAMGKQVHRSYWVNRNSVAEFQRLNQYSFQIILNNGVKVPVSRTRSTEIENWFRDLKK